MFSSIELLRPRLTPALQGWDLGIVLEALRNPLYDSLREASLKQSPMATTGRRSEFQAVGFNSKYIQFKPKGVCVSLYILALMSEHPKIRRAHIGCSYQFRSTTPERSLAPYLRGSAPP